MTTTPAITATQPRYLTGAAERATCIEVATRVLTARTAGLTSRAAEATRERLAHDLADRWVAAYPSTRVPPALGGWALADAWREVAATLTCGACGQRGGMGARPMLSRCDGLGWVCATCALECPCADCAG